MQGLSIHNLSAGYPKRQVITDLSIDSLPCGKVTVLLGPNGCGKSTLLRALAGLNRASGQLCLNGSELMSQPFSRRAAQVVYLPQSLPDNVHLHVLESIMVAAQAVNNHWRKVSEAEVMTLLGELGIAHLGLCYLDQLSGGQKQLVGLAQSLIRHPALLLLDEPLSALDLNYQYHVMELVIQETRRRNMVTVLVLHDTNLALRYGEYVVMLNHGEVVAQGEAAAVITPRRLASVYGVCGRIERCSQGIPVASIDGLVTRPL